MIHYDITLVPIESFSLLQGAVQNFEMVSCDVDHHDGAHPLTASCAIRGVPFVAIYRCCLFSNVIGPQ